MGTFVGETIVGMSVALVAAVGFSLWQRGFRPAVFLALVTAGVGGIYFVAGHVDPRQRPPVRILDPGLVPDHSFPSGHVILVAGIGCVVAANLPSNWWSVPSILTVLVMVGRVYVGAHNPLDVAAGLGAGLVLGGAVATFVN